MRIELPRAARATATVLLLLGVAAAGDTRASGATQLLGGITSELDDAAQATGAPAPAPALPSVSSPATAGTEAPRKASRPVLGAEDRQARIASTRSELEALRGRIDSIVSAPTALGPVSADLAASERELAALDGRVREARAAHDQRVQELAESADRGELDARALAQAAARLRARQQEELANLESGRGALEARRDQLRAARSSLERLAEAPAETVAREVFRLRGEERALEDELTALRTGALPPRPPGTDVEGASVGAGAPAVKVPQLHTLAERAREEGAEAARAVDGIIDRELGELERELRDSGLDAPETLKRFLDARREELESQRGAIERAVREVANARAEGLEERAALLAIEIAPLRAGSLVELDLGLSGTLEWSERFAGGTGERTVTATYRPLRLVYTLRAEREPALSPFAERAGDLLARVAALPSELGEDTPADVARAPFWDDVRTWLGAVERMSSTALVLWQRGDAPVQKFFEGEPAAKVTCTERYEPGDAESLVEQTITATAGIAPVQLAEWSWPDERPPHILILQGQPEDLARVERLGPRLSRPQFEPDRTELEILQRIWALADEFAAALPRVVPGGTAAFGVVHARVNAGAFDGAPLEWSAQRTVRTARTRAVETTRFRAGGTIGEANPALPGCLSFTPTTGLIRAPAGSSSEVTFGRSLGITSRQAGTRPEPLDAGYRTQAPWRGRASGTEDVTFRGADASSRWDHAYEIRWRLKPLSKPSRSRI